LYFIVFQNGFTKANQNVKQINFDQQVLREYMWTPTRFCTVLIIFNVLAHQS